MADLVRSFPGAGRAPCPGDSRTATESSRSPGPAAPGRHPLTGGEARDPRHALGLRGERIAEAWLVARGLRVLERRYRRRTGEIDLILEDGETIVFVEVKARRGTSAGSPAEAVTARKTARLGTTALAFLQEREWLERTVRFDVVEVLVPAGCRPRVRHIPDAFRPSG